MYDLNLSVPNITAEKYSTDSRFLILKNYLYELNEALSYALIDKSQAEIDAVKKEVEEGRNQETENIIRLNKKSKKRFEELKTQLIRTAEEILSVVEEYASHTSQSITEALSEGMANMGDDLSSVENMVNLLVSSFDVYIRTGELENGAFGVEIGRIDSKIKARFTNNRFSLFNGHSEVAYVVGGKLYITMAEIQNHLKIGNFDDGYFTFKTSENGLEVMWSDGR